MDAGLGPIADEFNQLALKYFDLFVGSSADKMAWLEKSEVTVAELYAAALRLPQTEPSGHDAPEMPMEDRSRLMAEAVERIGGDVYYSFVFHPLKANEEPVGTTLADDLASIYQDLYEGVELRATGGSHQDVIWTWRINFQIHWGRHALGALQALNALLR
jgi:uncharacterized protein DUF5063